MISGKKILIVGAGNAGRPVANLFNYLNNTVIVTDSNSLNKLPKKAQNQIEILKTRGISFDLGEHDYNLLNSIDYIYISPNIPKTVDFIKKIYELADEGKFDIINNADVGDILNTLIAIPMIGIAGTDGKTTTTNMINFCLKEKYNTLSFSSLQNSLVIEGLVEMIVNSQCKDKELAVFELPHGTIRMAQGLELDMCVITNLTPDHMDEFNSYDEYIERNIAIEKLLKNNGLALVNGDDPIISTRLDTFTHDSIIYGLKNPNITVFEGKKYYNDKVNYDIIATDINLNGLDGSSFVIKSNEFPTLICKNCGSTNCSCGNYFRKNFHPFERKISIKLPGLVNVENALVTILSSLIMGIDLDEAISRVSNFNGVKGRFEKIDKVNNVNVFMDAAHNPESMEKFFDGFNISGRLILSLDNPDTLTSRDKIKIGEILGKIADVLIVSSKNETTHVNDFDATSDVLKGVFNSHDENGTHINENNLHSTVTENGTPINENNLHSTVTENGTENFIPETYITSAVYESVFLALNLANNGDTIIHIGPGVVNAYDSVKKDIKDAIDFFNAISGKIVVIGGCGTVGSLIARVLASSNLDVTVSDSKKDTSLRDIFQNEGIKLDLGNNHDENLLYSASSFFLAPSLMKNDKLKSKLKEANFQENVPIFGVNDIYKFFKSNKAVIGITGTNGKTTTTEILKNIFRFSGLKIPEHFLKMQGNTEFIPSLQSKLFGDLAVIEIGTFGNIGEIESISKKAEVDTGIITNISHDHLSNCKNFEEYVSCKKEIVDVADNLILCADDPIVSFFAKSKDAEDLLFFGISDDFKFIKYFNIYQGFKENRNCPICGKDLSYHIHYLGHLGKYFCECGFKNPKLDISASNIVFNPSNSVDFDLNIYENHAKIRLEHGSIANVYNSLAAASGAWVSGISIENIAKGINSFKGVDGRLQIINDSPKIILDYAHNPAGVESIIQTLNTWINNSNSKSKLIIVNTISSESGEEGDLEIAKLLSNADIVIPASHTAYDFSKFIENDKSKVLNISSSKHGTKVGTLGANFNQVKEAIEMAISVADLNDLILIIGEGGLKFSKNILNKLSINNYDK